MTVMLVVVVIVIYSATIGGEGGMEQGVKETGGHLNGTIRSIDP